MITRRQSMSLLAASAIGAVVVPDAVGTPQRAPANAPDPLYAQPYVDIDEWRDAPVRHRYVHGGFKGTDCRFSLYFPPKEQYQGRFFQPISAVSGNENSAQAARNASNPAIQQESSTIGFAFASGGYLVDSNLGSTSIFPGDDPTIVGYRASAAVAKHSRVLAAEMYGPHRTYGYAYGGSGGSLKTISMIENTDGVWDGVVPYVTGCDLAMPNLFTVQAHAIRILKDKFPAIVDAVDPGGSGDMYAGLNKEERDALAEVTRMGFPPASWFAYKRVGPSYAAVFSTLVDNLVKWDPTYVDDFWKVPGYLGANPPQSLASGRIQHKTTITRVVMADEARRLRMPTPMAALGTGVVLSALPSALQLGSIPKGDLQGATVILTSGAAAGHVLSIPSITGDMVSVSFGEDQSKFVARIKAGDEVQIDNSIYLATQTYHRHQVPAPASGYAGWDQFRGKDGKPIYPQRPVQVGPRFQMGGGGSVQTGRFKGKMILLEHLMDEIAFPWQADWYRSKVKAALGSRLDDNFRLWYTEHAMHGGPTTPSEGTRIINYTGVLQQALRDVSAWAEKGVAPAASTNYRIVEGQVQVPATAAQRRGIQPTVTVTANGGARADVAVGKPVTFSAVVEAPPNTGKIVTAEWDFEGAGSYPVKGQMEAEASGSRVTVKATYSFTKPGTYFPALRVASQRQGDTSTPYARAQNLGRVRVVVV
jgi:hypothetical protein